ncbi:MAG: ArnT family glycosyltransferase [Gaiellaceae bacterium]
MTGSSSAETARRRPLDRALEALPLVLAYVLLCCLYAWQASRHDSPTIFTDELEFAQISRSIAETGESARRGAPYGVQTLYSYLVAPAWWIDDTASAYEAAKFIGVLVMTATIFPAYALARTIVSKPWALGAAVASAAIPALSYAPFLVEEPLAYPVATAALWLIVRALGRPTRWAIALAGIVAAGAFLVRAQLSILIPVFGVALALAGWRHPAFRRRRAAWTRWDWLGLAVLGLGAALALSAFLGHRSEEWYRATGFYKERMFDYGLRALGALVIGIGVLPFVAGLAAVLTRGRDSDRNVRAFALTSLAAFFTFGLYTAVKAAYISTEFGTVTVERNLIYVAPLLFAGTALLLERPGRQFIALGAAAVVALYVLLTTPYELDKYPYYDAPGLAIAALPNRVWRWEGERIEQGLIVVLLISVALLVGRSLVRGRRAAVLAAVAGALVVGWNVTAEIYAAEGQNDFARRLYENAPQPVDWLDRATGGEPALFLGDAVDDANGIHLLEFWNRSLKQVWSLDGSAPGPGPTLTPNLGSADGSLSPDPGFRWVVAENDADLVGTRVGAPHGSLQLYRLDGPLRLTFSRAGVTGDGWMGSTAAFNQFATSANPRGFAKVILSRVASCGPDKPGNVVVRVGTVIVGPKKQPSIGRVLHERRAVLHQCKVLGPPELLIPVTVPFRVEVTIEPTFSPNELDPASSDVRQLGAKPEFGYVPLP